MSDILFELRQSDIYYLDVYETKISFGSAHGSNYRLSSSCMDTNIATYFETGIYKYEWIGETI